MLLGIVERLNALRDIQAGAVRTDTATEADTGVAASPSLPWARFCSRHRLMLEAEEHALARDVRAMSLHDHPVRVHVRVEGGVAVAGEGAALRLAASAHVAVVCHHAGPDTCRGVGTARAWRTRGPARDLRERHR